MEFCDMDIRYLSPNAYPPPEKNNYKPINIYVFQLINTFGINI